MIAYATNPKGRHLPGWGAPGTEYTGVHFRSGILQTLQVIDTVLPSSQRLENTPIPTKSKHASPLAKYLPLLEGSQPLIPTALLPLLQLYENYLEDARWKAQEPTQEDYETCLRIVAVVVDVVGKRTGQPQTTT